ncbi:hypothetical protein O6H91_06G065100 [Diphasiastrum complanatum]|nr:hypothetical protein O6H91_06G065100 [Diphasiastrum complanatum]
MDLYHQMRQSHVQPDVYTYAAILNACACCSALEEGKLVHTHILESGLKSDIFLGNCLVDMYSKCGSLEAARRVFNEMSQRDVASWNAIISGCAHLGNPEEALYLLKEMQRKGIKPDKYTFVPTLKACGSVGAVDEGGLIHAQIRMHRLEADLYVGSALVDMYAKCGHVERAYQVFQEMPERNVVCWNTMISAYVQVDLVEDALNLFNTMQKEGFEPDRVTYLSILKACSSSSTPDQGKSIHAQVCRSGLDLDIFVGSALVDMYAKFRCIDEALAVFLKLPKRDIVAWNAIIAGYAQCGNAEEALKLFESMQKEGLKPDKLMYVTILKACGNMAALDQGKLMHVQLRKNGLESDPFVGGALVDMYAKCGRIDKACQAFRQISEQDAFLWNSLIAGCITHGYANKALELFRQMKIEGLMPDKVTFVSALQACAQIGALVEGKLIHSQLRATGLDLDLSVGSTLIDMYGKCGCLDEACQVFFNLPQRTLVLWNAMINGYAQQGHGQVALGLFEKMQQEGLKPNHVTFLCVLSACSHAGLVEEGYELFGSMQESFSITPTMEHYTCMVDLLGRAGRLNEAHAFVSNMAVQPSAAVWISLLGACRTHGDVELGKVSFESLVKLEPTNASAYVLMTDIYLAATRQEDKVQRRI